MPIPGDTSKPLIFIDKVNIVTMSRGSKVLYTPKGGDDGVERGGRREGMYYSDTIKSTIFFSYSFLGILKKDTAPVLSHVTVTRRARSGLTCHGGMLYVFHHYSMLEL